jgi:hypothetical protein
MKRVNHPGGNNTLRKDVGERDAARFQQVAHFIKHLVGTTQIEVRRRVETPGDGARGDAALKAAGPDWPETQA